ncbi:MAG: hypothetical protein Q7J69_04760 [Candidatus Omnitrophota bacterium]|nr:hypothetical protein [Candidatus Omnitrophota bacterium]
MPIVPHPDPSDFRYKKKTPSLDGKEKFAIVCDALIAATENNTSGEVALTPNPKNQLDKLYRYETLVVLETMVEQSAHAFAISQTNYGKELIPPNEREDTFVFPNYTGISEVRKPVPAYRPAPLPESIPITLILFSEFNNWREILLHRRRIKLSDLTPLNKQKVREAVLDIDEKFQLNPSQIVRITWVPASSTQNHDARRYALLFLKNKGVVDRFEFPHSNLGMVLDIRVEIDIKRFNLFKAELLKLPESQFDADTSEPQPIPLAQKKDASKPFQHLKWDALTVQFLDGHNVKISGKDTKTPVTAHYKEMGFEDARNRKPNQQWEFLKLLAMRGGEFSWDDSEARDTLKKKKQLLSKTLRDCFGIKGDPFYPYKENSSYRIKINLTPESDSR